MGKEKELEQYIQYGISGNPEIKKKEKEKYLGEFLERVILAIEVEDLNGTDYINKIKDVMKNNASVDKLIVNSALTNNIRIQCMKLAKEHDKDFKLVEGKTTIGIVLASNSAV